jgi:hypothetical protein
MSPQEQESIFHHLEGLQKKDWTQLSLDEKKACTSRPILASIHSPLATAK